MLSPPAGKATRTVPNRRPSSEIARSTTVVPFLASRSAGPTVATGSPPGSTTTAAAPAALGEGRAGRMSASAQPSRRSVCVAEGGDHRVGGVRLAVGRGQVGNVAPIGDQHGGGEDGDGGQGHPDESGRQADPERTEASAPHGLSVPVEPEAVPGPEHGLHDLRVRPGRPRSCGAGSSRGSRWCARSPRTRSREPG